MRQQWHIFINIYSLARIAEIGAGTGRYSLTLSQEGYQVEAVLQYCFGQMTLWEDLEKGLLTDDFVWQANENDAFSLVRPADIKELTKDFPVERLKLIATDGASRYLSDKLERMDDKLYQKYLEYHFSICERQDLIGASNHVLDILRKV